MDWIIISSIFLLAFLFWSIPAGYLVVKKMKGEGMDFFKPFGEKSYAMQYYEVPIDVLEDRGKIKVWAEKELQVAVRKLTAAKNTKRKKKLKQS